MISRPSFDLADSETNEKWKSVLRNVCFAPVQHEGMDYKFDIVLDIDLNHNAMSSKDRSSLFDGKMISKPDERIDGQILEWLNKGVVAEAPTKPALPSHVLGVAISVQAPVPKARSAQSTALTGHITAPAKQASAPKAPEHIPLFDSKGEIAGERETAAMLEGVKKATTLQRLLSIEKSRHLGFNTDRLTLDQARADPRGNR